jgi:Holliday junction resolvase RusA-like endonuclease
MRYSAIDIRGLNPEPWEPSRAAPVRKGSKLTVAHYKPAKLETFQAALIDTLERHENDPYVSPWEPQGNHVLKVHFWLWRTQEVSTRQSGRKHRAHQADATNMQKAIEDACQGILFGNDRDNRHVATTIVDQGHDIEPRIIIERFLAVRLPTPPTKFDLTIDLTDRWEGNDIAIERDVPDDVF